ncbi:MAG: AraC family transcriptional regulator, partial [Lachnospiraceae bacterium]|nr:AraC family transcriptional regulator [Lachnospiraceae bacterium]
LDQVNRDYGIHFSPRLYRALIIKMDCSKDIMSVFENDVLRDKIIQIIRKHLTEFCFDILYDKLADGVMILFNYANVYHDKIQSEYHQIFTEVKQAFQTFDGVIVTMCISHEYDHYLKLPEAKAEVLDIRWARKYVGTDKILSAETLSTRQEPSVSAQSELQKLKEQVLHSFQILDLKESHTCMVKFFSCLRRSSDAISNRDARLLIRSMIDSLFEMHWGILTTRGDVEAMRHEFIYKTNMAQSMERLQHDFIQSAEEILTTVSEAVKQHYSRPVLTAINYIQKNIRSPLSLNEIADLAGLTAPYFSSIFKKETGQTFSDYTAACRLDIAKKMLRESNATISEISDHLGYSDSKYFTKMFKKKEQISPSEYRRILRAEEKIE